MTFAATHSLPNGWDQNNRERPGIPCRIVSTADRWSLVELADGKRQTVPESCPISRERWTGYKAPSEQPNEDPPGIYGPCDI